MQVPESFRYVDGNTVHDSATIAAEAAAFAARTPAGSAVRLRGASALETIAALAGLDGHAARVELLPAGVEAEPGRSEGLSTRWVIFYLGKHGRAQARRARVGVPSPCRARGGRSADLGPHVPTLTAGRPRRGAAGARQRLHPRRGASRFHCRACRRDARGQGHGACRRHRPCGGRCCSPGAPRAGLSSASRSAARSPTSASSTHSRGEFPGARITHIFAASETGDLQQRPSERLLERKQSQSLPRSLNDGRPGSITTAQRSSTPKALYRVSTARCTYRMIPLITRSTTSHRAI